MSIDYYAKRLCPVHNTMISDAICMETEAVLSGVIKPSSVPEMAKVKNTEEKLKVCRQCKYCA